MLPEPEFPSAARFGGRLRFDAFEVERFKRSLAGLPGLARDPEKPIRFVDASDVCADLGIDRRTLGRRVRGRIRGQTGDGADNR
jgi:hypothetical protein